LTDSLYISASSGDTKTNKFEIMLLPVRRGGRETKGGWRREERLPGNKIGRKLLEFDKR
jgi:hypothetical protein